MTQQLTNKHVFDIMEEWAPKHLAYDWDNVGLQVGSLHKPVKKIMITLDVIESVADEAIAKEADLIISHHPLLFKAMKQIDIDTPKGRTIRKLLQHDITVYSSHTNLDAADGGVNDMLCDLLDISPRQPLINTKEEKLYKIAVYVPVTHAQTVQDALSEAEAGHIGNYSHCTFRTEGQGTFKPLEGTNPFIGKQNELEIVKEMKIESVVTAAKREQAVKAMMLAHPYEEVAYDMYQLQNQGPVYGIGRIGNLNEQVTLQEFCGRVKTAFDLSHVRVTGDMTKKIRKAAILGGSGEKFISQAKQMGADVYITGDMTFHTAQDAEQMGLAVIDAGHYIEKVMKESTRQYFDSMLQGKAEIIISETPTDPFHFI